MTSRKAHAATHAHSVSSEVSGAGKPKPKNELAIGLMQRSEGATLDDLVSATGWLPHTARAALTGLRKKGHAITKAKTDGMTRYSIGPSA